jgi:hypothetical protein
MGVDEARNRDELVPTHLCTFDLRTHQLRRIMDRTRLQYHKADRRPQKKEQVSLRGA